MDTPCTACAHCSIHFFSWDKDRKERKGMKVQPWISFYVWGEKRNGGERWFWRLSKVLLWLPKVFFLVRKR
jgi:hypothetical protein